MNDVEKKLFEKLIRDREDSARVHDKPSEKGFWNSVDEKYTDRGHFVYELIQNADDAEAQYAKFILNDEELVFIHNGKKHFSVTDVDKEEEDTLLKKLGHINSITSIGNSTKTDASIGKFGVGFKAVFQYTNTPYIYDDEFKFMLKKHIVPEILYEDYKGRKRGETIFVLPFNHKKTHKEKAFNDIKARIESLIYPTLFLNHLNDLTFTINEEEGEYKKEVKNRLIFDNTEAKKINISKIVNGENEEDVYWMFSRKDDNNRNYDVGFRIDNDNKLKPINKYAFCYFSTKEQTNLNFIINAPFLLTDNRQGILAGNEYNKNLINLLANLSADSIEYLKNIENNEGKRIVDDNIINIIPTDVTKFTAIDDIEQISFLPFYEEIKKAFLEKEIIPTKNGYTFGKNAYWASTSSICEVFSNKQLRYLLNNNNAYWVFCSINRSVIKYNKSDENLVNYIDSLVNDWVDENDILKYINEDFIVSQDIKWLFEFYDWLSKSENRKNKVKSMPIFLDEKNNPVALFDSNDRLITFLPNKEIKDCQYIKQELLDNESTCELLKSLGIKEPSLRDYIYNVIRPLYQDSGKLNNWEHFDVFFKYYLKCSNENIDSFIDDIKKLDFISYFSNGECYRGKASDIYMPTNELKNYFDVKADTNFLNYDEYLSRYENKKEKLNEFFDKLGIKKDIKIYEKEITRRNDMVYHYSTYGNKYIDKIIDGCEENIKNIVEFENKERSFNLWTILINIPNRWKNFHGEEKYFYYSNKMSYFISTNLYDLRNSKWLVSNDGRFVSPNEITINELSKEYNIQDENGKDFIEYLNFKVYVEVQDDDIEIRDLNIEWEKQGKDHMAIIIPKEFENDVRKLIDKKERVRNSMMENKNVTLKELFGNLKCSDVFENNDCFENKVSSIINIEKRENNIKNEINSSKKTIHISKIKISNSNEEGNENEKEFLKQQYNGECQICGERILDKNNNPYFHCTDLIPKSQIIYDENKANNLAWDALCLCPNCSAKHQLGLVDFGENFDKVVKDYDIPEKSNEYIKFNIKVRGKDALLNYAPKHLQNLQVYIKEIEKNEDSIEEEKNDG